MCMREMPVSFLLEATDRSDEMLMGGVADPIKDGVRHHCRAAEVISGSFAMDALAELLSPVL